MIFRKIIKKFNLLTDKQVKKVEKSKENSVLITKTNTPEPFVAKSKNPLTRLTQWREDKIKGKLEVA